MSQSYPKRLIEVDLPIKRISAHARREKSIRHGHISTLHIWWARRPLAACRAEICAALWPDPADENCPPVFIKQARKLMLEWTTHERQNLLSTESRARFEAARQQPKKFDDATELRDALLDFIADFANWDSSTVPEYLATSRALTQAAHEALGGAPGTRPLVVDPFAGGGSIPLEALRVGADAFASDLNPVPVLLNKVVLEYIPKYGQRLADEVRKWGEWIKREAEKELAEFYPKDADGATPIAYLWARTIQCEGPGCGAEVPLIRSQWLFGLEFDGKCCWYCLEADRATMPITRGDLSQTSFQRKLLAYEATWTQQLHKKNFGWQRFRVLTVTTNAERVQGMIAACQQLKQGRGLFLFTDTKTLAGQPDFLALRWRTFRDGQGRFNIGCGTGWSGDPTRLSRPAALHRLS